MPVKIQDEEKQVHAFLRKHKVGVLATVTPQGKPHAAAIYYTVDSDLKIRFLTVAKTQKAINLRHDNHATLVVYDAATQSTVQLQGTAADITDITNLNKIYRDIVFASIDTSDTDIPPVSKIGPGEYEAFCLTPTRVHMAIFNSPHAKNYKDIFEVTFDK